MPGGKSLHPALVTHPQYSQLRSTDIRGDFSFILFADFDQGYKVLLIQKNVKTNDKINLE